MFVTKRIKIMILVSGVVIVTGCGRVRPGQQLSDFVPEGWQLIDSVEPDYNEDGVMDYVEVQESVVRENPYEHSMYELLDGESVEEYLENYGAGAETAVRYNDLEGMPNLELYYDRETGRGCGLRYVKTEDGTELLGFPIEGYGYKLGSDYWNFPNPFSTQIVYGEARRIDRIPGFLYKTTTGLSETYSYDLENRLCAYHLRGRLKTEEGEGEEEELFTVSFFYRENGTLQEKIYQFEEEAFRHESVGGNWRFVYDGLERLLYTEEMVPGVMGECYYLIYEGDSMIPVAYLHLFAHSALLERVEERDYHNRVDVPRDGVDAFLDQVGLSQEDKLHEYRWHNESTDHNAWSHSDEVLTLYYDPDRELGCGYVDYPGEAFEDMSGFMFKGCMEIDCDEYDPYGVFARYEGDSASEIDLGDLPPEKLPDAYENESMYICEYDGERLVRMWMYGTGSATEKFYIYEGGNDMPSYCLNLVSGVEHGATLFKFIYH